MVWHEHMLTLTVLDSEKDIFLLSVADKDDTSLLSRSIKMLDINVSSVNLSRR